MKNLKKYWLKLTNFFITEEEKIAKINLVDYFANNFYFNIPDLKRSTFFVNIKNIAKIENLIERLNPNDACYIGIIIGEYYADSFRKNKTTMKLPINKLSSREEKLAILNFHIEKEQIEIIDTYSLQRTSYHLLDLVKNIGLISDMPASHAYQAGFYAGELIFKNKHPKFINQNNIIAFPMQQKNNLCRVSSI